MLDSHPVSIWNGTTGALVASSTIDAASGYFTTHFLYNLISPVTLQAGQIYEITGVSGIDNYAYGDTGWTLYAPVTYAGYNYCLGCGDVFTGTGTTNLGVGDAFWGPNFGWTTTATPEPGSLMLLGTGVLGLAGVIRRKINL
jgi:PEP-CTERM motif